MDEVGTELSFCDNNTNSETHLSLAQTMNEYDRQEAMKDEVSNENDEHAEPQGKVTYLLVSKDKDFASKSISRENFFLIGANTKYRPAVRVSSRCIPWKFH